MNSNHLVAGIDVSKCRLDITIYDGKQENSFDIPYNQSSFNKIMNRFDNETIHIVCEATGNYHLRLAKFTYDLGSKFSSVNPFIIKRYSDIMMKRAKTDRIDSSLIARYGFEFKPKQTLQLPQSRIKMKQLLKAIEDIHQTEQDYRNRLEAHSVNPYGVKEVEDTYRQVLQVTATKREEMEHELIKIAKSQHPQSYKLLISIPGVGPIGSAVIIAFFGRFETFETSKQVISFIGTNPSIIESGKFKGKSRMSRKGSSYIRKKLYMCAISASRHNHMCNQLYQRLQSRGMAKKPALVAVMNKLIKQAFGILKSDKPYKKNFLKK